MEPAAAIRSALAVLQRPDDVLPVYFLTPAVSVVVQTVVTGGVAVAMLYLWATSRLERVLAALAGRELQPPPPDAPAEAFDEWAASIAPALEPVATPVVALVAVATVLAAVVVFAAVVVAVTAAQLSACHGRLRDRRGMTAAVRGVGRFWTSILLVRVLEVAIWAVTVVTALATVAVALLAGGLVGVFVSIVVVPAATGVLLAARAVFAFTVVAVVVDDVGVGDAVRGTLEFIAVNPAAAVAYYVLAAVGVVGLSALAVLLAIVGGAPLVTVLGFAFVAPFLDLVKTGLYGGHRGTVSPPAAPDERLVARLGRGLRRGCREAVTFVRRAPHLHGLAAAILLGGGVLGWWSAGPFADAVSTSIAGRLADHEPVTATATFAANNWTVAVGASLGGLVLAVPAASALLVNGVVLGVYARTEEAPLELLAFVLPHGILELPAIVVAGALGLHLGVVAWRSWVGNDGEALAEELRRAFWVLVGLGVVLVVAAIVEGFVSPYYYRPFL